MIKSSLSFLFAVACLALPSGAYAKSKLGEYFIGFSYFSGDASGADIDVLDIELSNPTSNSNDVKLGLAWMNVDQAGGGDDTTWWLDADLVYHYDDFMNGGGMFRPYASLGVGYFNDSGNINWRTTASTGSSPSARKFSSPLRFPHLLDLISTGCGVTLAKTTRILSFLSLTGLPTFTASAWNIATPTTWTLIT